jgi:hypothetical protein
MRNMSLGLDEMITLAESRLERLRGATTAHPLENGRTFHYIYLVLSEIEDQLTPLNEGDRRTFEEELTKKES